MSAFNISIFPKIPKLTWRAVAVLAFAALVAACGEKQQQQQGGGPPPPAVTVASPTKQTVSDYDEYVGRFAAVNLVEMRARVSGYLEAIHFKDGAVVPRGSVLLVLDAAVQEAELQQARANLALAQANFRRNEELFNRFFRAKKKEDAA